MLKNLGVILMQNLMQLSFLVIIANSRVSSGPWKPWNGQGWPWKPEKPWKSPVKLSQDPENAVCLTLLKTYCKGNAGEGTFVGRIEWFWKETRRGVQGIESINICFYGFFCCILWFYFHFTFTVCNIWYVYIWTLKLA